MAKGLDLQLIAEGVETQEQMQFLLSHQCDLAQGYYFGRPCSKELFFLNIQKGLNPHHKTKGKLRYIQ